VRFTVYDDALHALAVVDDAEARRLLAAFEMIASDPIGYAEAIGWAARGQEAYLRRVGRFSLYYWIGVDGRVAFLNIMADSET
jgi:hypothetical protein